MSKRAKKQPKSTFRKQNWAVVKDDKSTTDSDDHLKDAENKEKGVKSLVSELEEPPNLLIQMKLRLKLRRELSGAGNISESESEYETEPEKEPEKESESESDLETGNLPKFGPRYRLNVSRNRKLKRVTKAALTTNAPKLEYSVSDQNSSGTDHDYTVFEQEYQVSDHGYSGSDQYSSGTEDDYLVYDQYSSKTEHVYSVSDQGSRALEHNYSVFKQSSPVLEQGSKLSKIFAKSRLVKKSVPNPSSSPTSLEELKPVSPAHSDISSENDESCVRMTFDLAAQMIRGQPYLTDPDAPRPSAYSVPWPPSIANLTYQQYIELKKQGALPTED